MERFIWSFSGFELLPGHRVLDLKYADDIIGLVDTR